MHRLQECEHAKTDIISIYALRHPVLPICVSDSMALITEGGSMEGLEPWFELVLSWDTLHHCQGPKTELASGLIYFGPSEFLGCEAM